MMTDTEAIAAVLDGKRCETQFTQKEFPNEGAIPCQHSWRTVACDDVMDVIECRNCGRQKTCKCNFDEDFA